MKIFISWSGEPSRTVALALRDWLRRVIQSVDPYVSSEDIYKGGQWFAEIARELDDTDFGIICVTSGNTGEPWLNFEAGAIFKSVGTIDKIRRQVTPFLIDLEPADLTGPLGNLQATEANRDDVTRLVRSLNALNDQPEQRLDDALLNDAIEMWWPRLQQQLDAAREAAQSQPQPESRTDRSMIAEVLERTRGIERRITQPTAGAVNVRTSEQEGYRTKKIYDDIWEVLYGADIRHRFLSVGENTVNVEVYYLADLPEDVKAALDGLAERRGLKINVTTIEHPDPAYVARR